ncbi:uncharacterized protein LOC128942958 [Melozone crissalis]|uniref:uncharacterized protein LOC128942958 n=1 Tax=Melozone crissalis TaxID=40204 RepID=UPI0023D98BA0|nr:uncharacterized protein LOC128942958 [Melozone crissalis]
MRLMLENKRLKRPVSRGTCPARAVPAAPALPRSSPPSPARAGAALLLPAGLSVSTFPAKPRHLVNSPHVHSVRWDSRAQGLLIDLSLFQRALLSLRDSCWVALYSFQATQFCSFELQLHCYSFHRLTEPTAICPMAPSAPGEEAQEEQIEMNARQTPSLPTAQPGYPEPVLLEREQEQIASTEMPWQTQGELFPAREQEEQLRQQVEEPQENGQKIKAEPQAELPEAQSDIMDVKRKNKEDLGRIQEENLDQQRGDQQNQVSERVVDTPPMKHPLSCFLEKMKSQLIAELQTAQTQMKARQKKLEDEIKIIREKLNPLPQSLQKQVAIKKINLKGLRKKKLKVNELMVMKINRNPNLINYLDCYLVGDELWLVMEFMDGGTLSDIISKTCLSEDQMAAISRECLRGLDFLHSNHVIYQDVKSCNILLRTNGSVKLADFGLFAQLTPEQSRRSSVAGTCGWLVPEVVTGQPHGPKVDIWSFGIVGIEMVEREVPCRNATPFLAQLTARGERPQLRQPNRFSSCLCDFLSCCLQTDEQKRWSARELLKHPFVRSAKPAYSLAPLINSIKMKKKKEDWRRRI